MKPALKLPAWTCLGLSALSALAQPQTGGRFSLDATTIPAGSAAAQGGRFAVEATIDPAAAERGPASRFQLEGGFWSLVTVQQTPGAPELRIQLLPDGLIRLSWSAEATGFTLQGNTELGAKGWQTVLVAISKSETEHSVTVSGTDPLRCYRLWQ